MAMQLNSLKVEALTLSVINNLVSAPALFHDYSIPFSRQCGSQRCRSIASRRLPVRPHQEEFAPLSK